MSWLRRAERARRSSSSPSHRTAWDSSEWSMPGVATLFEKVGRTGTRAVLDLGPAADSSMRVYGDFARRIRFADLLTEGWAAAPDALPLQPEHPYDLVFAWDMLDRLFPEQRPRLVNRLVEVTAPGAYLHVLVEASDRARVPPLRFALLDVGRLRCEPTGPARPIRHRLLPAHVERLLAPFRVERAVALKAGFREYVAVRGER